ncbi:MAG: hypothetical protein ACK4HW_12640 [Roseinatronobacter sp.]
MIPENDITLVADTEIPADATTSAMDAPRRPAIAFAPISLTMPFRHIFNDPDLQVIDPTTSEGEILFKERLKNTRDELIALWGRLPLAYRRKSLAAGLPVVQVDEGFLRGPELPGRTSLPLSYVVDDLSPYYDGTTQSRLEKMLATYEFEADPDLMQSADALIAEMVAKGVGSFSHGIAPRDMSALYGRKSHKRVLVLGHHPEARALLLGNVNNVSNVQALLLARREHPGAQIIFKPHPQYLAQAREACLAEVNEHAHEILVLDLDIPLAAALDGVDHVVTVCSLGGFEAALRGVPVTVLGAPFYAGWGITDDRAAPERRTRRLSVAQVFACAYLRYPVYFDTMSNGALAPATALSIIAAGQTIEAEQNQSRAEAAILHIGRKLPGDLLMQAVPHQTATTISPNDANLNTVLARHVADMRGAHPSAMAPVVVQSPLRASVQDLVAQHPVQVIHLDPGFLFGDLEQSAPDGLSVLVARLAPHYDGSRVSDLEQLLATYDFDADSPLMERAARLRERLNKAGMGRFHYSDASTLGPVLAAKSGKRVLVIGHNPTDLGTAMSNPRGYDNLDLVRLARREHPNAEIIFRPHPAKAKAQDDAIAAIKAAQPDVSVGDWKVPLAEFFQGVDHIVTLASLGGFEAAMRGIPVTTFGTPFYAGWGITDDRAAPARRTRRLTVDQVVAGAYLLYPTYFDPLYKAVTTPEALIDVALEARSQKPAPTASALFVRVEKPAVSPVPSDPPALPAWFRQHPGPELQRALDSDQPVFLFLPWIAEHSDVLITRVKNPSEYLIAPFDIVDGVSDNEIRRQAFSFARERPDLYRRMIMRRLIALKRRISGFILTFDWAPIARLISTCCKELSIPTILVPHESVFVDRDKYYWDPRGKASLPVCDVVLGWGDLQRSIFAERGFDVESRFKSLGAPKFDTYVNFTPSLSREEFCGIFGLDPAKKIALFATQALDSQTDTKVARRSQRQAISDLLEESARLDCQVIVRLPPSKDDVLGKVLRQQMDSRPGNAVDDAICYIVPPEEAIYHADVVLSINSTMLFEAVLMGRQAISQKYVDFIQIWEPIGIPAPRNQDQFRPVFEQALKGSWKPSETGMAWAANQFGSGVFDGKAAVRIREELTKIAQGSAHQITPSVLSRLLMNEQLDVLAIPRSDEILVGCGKYLHQLVRGRTIVAANSPTLIELVAVEAFLQWGLTKNALHAAQADAARAMGRPVVIVEDGFLRSLAIGLSGDPALSIILDDKTAYYDATRVSRLEMLMQDGPDLTPEQHSRARNIIDLIRAKRLSKYNHAPDTRLQIGEPGRPKLLLIDQRFGDQSIASGMASEDSFNAMLFDAVRERPDHDIIVKQHPDAIGGGKLAYFTPERLAQVDKLTSRLHPIAFDVNPHALFDLCDEAWVATSGMGFEALMAGLPVRCYGVPWYSGWGLTEDKQTLPRRTRARDIEAAFHFAWIALSRYVDPEAETPCEIEDLIAHICRVRGW